MSHLGFFERSVWSRFNLSRILVICVATLFLRVDLTAQNSEPIIKEGTILFHMHQDRRNPPGTGEEDEKKWYWILDQLPEKGEVNITDPDVRDTILEDIETLRQNSKDEEKEILVVSEESESFFRASFIFGRILHILQDQEMLFPPEGTGQKQNKPALSSFRKINADTYVLSFRYLSIEKKITPSPVTFILEDPSMKAGQSGSLKLGKLESGDPRFAGMKEHERDSQLIIRAKGADASPLLGDIPKDWNCYLPLMEDLLNIAREKHIFTMTSGDEIRDAPRHIEDRLQKWRNSWNGRMRVSVYVGAPHNLPSKYVVVISPVVPVRKIELSITTFSAMSKSYDRKDILDKKNPASALEESLNTAEKKLKAAFHEDLQQFPGRMATETNMEKLRIKLEKDSHVQGALIDMKDGTMNVKVHYVAQANAFRVSASYGSSDGLLGTATYQLIPVSKHDQFAVSLNAGQEMQGGKVEYKRDVSTLAPWKNWTWINSANWLTDLTYQRQTNLKLGPSEPSDVNQQEGSMGTGIDLAGSHEEEKILHTWNLGPSLRIRERRFQDYSPLSTVASNERQVLLGLNENASSRWRPSEGFLGAHTLRWGQSAELTHAISLLDHDASYVQGTVSGGFEMQFGKDLAKTWFIRLPFSLGLTESDTPLPDQFRLGGSYLRGMEEGERVGRSLLFVEASTGVSVFYLFGLAGGKPPELPAQLDLNKFFLVGFVEAAQVTPEASLGKAFELNHVVPGTGAAVEYEDVLSDGKPVNLRLGYGWSPESVHEHGRYFIEASLGF